MADIYVDESGDLGRKGERYFVIALIAAKNQKRLKNIVKHFCASNNINEIKASRLAFPEKQGLINKLCSIDDHQISYIVVDKRNIANTKLFEDKNLIYNYIFQHLIKPIIKASVTDLDIVLDNHSIKVKSANSLREYIKIKASGTIQHLTLKTLEINIICDVSLIWSLMQVKCRVPAPKYKRFEAPYGAFLLIYTDPMASHPD